MTKDAVQKAVNKKTAAISNEIPNINLLEVLDNMIAVKEIDVFISGYSDNEIHPCDIRLELLALYKARDLFTKERSNEL